MKKEFIIDLKPIYKIIKEDYKKNSDVYTIEDFPFYRDIISDYIFDNNIIDKMAEEIKKMLLTNN